MPRLVIKEGPGVGRDHMLGPVACTVGRDAGADFVLEDTSVFRKHFRVVLDGSAYFVEDLGSTNGTLVNGRKAKRIRLSDGDLIHVGETRLTFVQKDLLKKAPAPVRRRKHIR